MYYSIMFEVLFELNLKMATSRITLTDFSEAKHQSAVNLYVDMHYSPTLSLNQKCFYWE